MDPTSASGPTRPPDPRASACLSASDPPPPHFLNGVVVVGFISRRPDDSSQLINRVLDSNVFGSGNLDRRLGANKDEARDWCERRRISYYHEEAKGILFLQFSPTRCPAFDGSSDLPASGFDSVYEEHDFGDLQGLLFMLTVCHVVIYMQEGSRFNSQILKKFRVLQAAKQALFPYIRSRITTPSTSRAHSSFPTRPSVSTVSSATPSTVRGGILSRNASYASLLPGQCTPVMLFVFVDDYSDMPNSSAPAEESINTSSNYSLNMSSLTRSAGRGSGSVVVLARPGSKSELSSRKKLQSSLEAQIRFLMKKCRTLSGSESSHAGFRAGFRAGNISSTTPLFLLDASKTVVLLDRCANRKGESLDFVTGLVEDVLNGKANSDSLLLESCSHSVNRDDIFAVREFIYRQADTLRGRGGSVANTNSSSGHGVGMVAVAAAAAAASASSGKACATSELPSFDAWLSHSQLILLDVITAKGESSNVTEDEKKKPRQQNVVPSQSERISPKGVNSLDIAMSWLTSGKGLNTKFSTLWCERSLSAARDVYLRDLPACYPTSVHETHLREALLAFNAMVRGVSVEVFTKRLENECTGIWKSGRQLCDAVSLTGKPCIYQKHDVKTGELSSGEVMKPHSSGYVFLRACACGRSRSICADPFDFESANSALNCFPDCDNVLANVKLPELCTKGPIKSSAWSLIRVGGARYYEPSKGLLQSGFCASQKFLLRWTIYLEKQSVANSSKIRAVMQDTVAISSTDPQVVLNNVRDITEDAATPVFLGDVRTGNTKHGNSVDNNRISFGRDLSNVNMKKPFSEVVAGLATMDSTFPPLQQTKQISCGLDKRVKQKASQAQSMESGQTDGNRSRPERVLPCQQISKEMPGISGSWNDLALQIGSNVVPVNMVDGDKLRSNRALSQVTAFIGFEHECPCGHRFILNSENLSQLGYSYAMHETAGVPLSKGNPNGMVNQPLKLEKHAVYTRGRRKSNKMASASNKLRNTDKPIQMVTKGYREAKEQNQASITAAGPPELVGDLQTHLQSVKVVDNENAFLMLKGKLPIYMNCPYCLAARKAPSDIKFAGKLSQLQRIYLVTPPYPVVLATCPVIQFQESCLPPSVPNRQHRLQFSLGCPVILPPESFLTLRLPFVYGVQLDDGTILPLKPLEEEPDKTAWVAEGTALQIVSKESVVDEKLQT